MTLQEQQIIFSEHVGMLIDYIYANGYGCTFGDAYCAPEMAQIYAQQGKGIKDSLHCKRLAIDLNLISPEGKYITNTKDYQRFGLFWEKLDTQNRWGGNFKDRPDGNHFERQEIIFH